MKDNQAFFTLRADQYSSDPAKWFVKPPIDIPSLDYGDHPIRLIGSRGCGKTMLLRAIAERPFGESLTGLNQKSQTKIRIYIRPDNQLMNSFKGWGLPLEVWSVASQELMLLKIFREAVVKIDKWLEQKGNNQSLQFDEDTFTFIKKDSTNTREWIRIALRQLYIWSRCPNKTPPITIASLDSLHELLATLPTLYPEFPKEFTISVYIDELETYQKHQQELINDWIKNPPSGWVFHVAHRRYLDFTRKTSSDEMIEESNDYMEIDLDKPLLDFKADGRNARREFYSKIIANELESFGEDTESISKALLPEINSRDICENLRNLNTAKEAWVRLLKKAYTFNKETEVSFNEVIALGKNLIDSRWWVFLPVLVARNRLDIIQNLESESSKQLLRNHLHGSILQIYIESDGKVPQLLYSGFDRICSIVLSNVREFMLIVKESIENERLSHSNKTDLEVIESGVSYLNQVKAIQNRSRSFSIFVSISANKFGFDLQQALDNWYFYFRKLQSLPNLPYNEPNHFVSTDPTIEQANVWEIIKAGEMHGGFIKEAATKVKEGKKEGQSDIRLHPLICVWKSLSNRKRNAPSFDRQEIENITNARDTNEVEKIFNNKYSMNNLPKNMKLL